MGGQGLYKTVFPLFCLSLKSLCLEPSSFLLKRILAWMFRRCLGHGGGQTQCLGAAGQGRAEGWLQGSRTGRLWVQAGTHATVCGMSQEWAESRLGEYPEWRPLCSVLSRSATVATKS